MTERFVGTISPTVPDLEVDVPIIPFEQLRRLPGYIVCGDYKSPAEIYYLSIHFSPRGLRTMQDAWNIIMLPTQTFESNDTGEWQSGHFDRRNILIDEGNMFAWNIIFDRLNQIITKHPIAVTGHNGIGPINRRGNYQISRYYYDRVADAVTDASIRSYRIDSHGGGEGIADSSFSFFL